MNDQERINYLILALTSNNARVFAEKVGMSTTSLSKLRNGERKLINFAARILAAFPQVSEDWLLYGRGEPIIKKTEPDYGAIWEKLGDLEKKMDNLIKMMREATKNG